MMNPRILTVPVFVLAIGVFARISALPSQERSATGVSVQGMSRYGDEFGFSFWYPASWSVTSQPVNNCAQRPRPAVCPANAVGWLQEGTIVKQLRVGSLQTGIVVQAFQSKSRSILELGATHSAGPFGEDLRYSFDPATRGWMRTILRSLATQVRTAAITRADVTQKTMGGLPILAGAMRHGADSIVPLSESRFVVVESLDPGNPDQRYFARTIMGADDAVAERASDTVQLETIRAWRTHIDSLR